MSDYNLLDLAVLGVWYAPGLLLGVLTVGLAIGRRLPRVARGLLIGGGAAVIVANLAGWGWLVAVPTVVREAGIERIQTVTGVASAALSLLHLVALALLVAAALAGRQVTGAPAPLPPPGTPVVPPPPGP